MKPILFHIGPFPVYGYGLMIMFGFLVAMFVVMPLLKKRGITANFLVDITLIAILSGLIGGRIFFVLQFPEHFDFLIFDGSEGISLAGMVAWFFAISAMIGNSTYKKITLLGFGLLILLRNFPLLPPIYQALHIFDFLYIALVLVLGSMALPKVLPKCIQQSQKSKIGWIAFVFISSFVVGRAYYCYQFPNVYSWQMFVFWQGGLVFHGGLICSIFTVGYYCYYHKIPILIASDILIIGVAIGLGITRIGCFLNGCCFGVECSNSSHCLAVQYPANSIPAQNVNLRGINIQHIWEKYAPAHLQNFSAQPKSRSKILKNLRGNIPEDLYNNIFRPIYATQILSSIKGFLLFILMFFFYPYRRYDGEVVLLFGILYGMARFSIELIRADTPFIWGTGFTDGQLFAIATFLLCSGIWIFRTSQYYWRKHERSRLLSSEEI